MSADIQTKDKPMDEHPAERDYDSVAERLLDQGEIGCWFRGDFGAPGFGEIADWLEIADDLISAIEEGKKNVRSVQYDQANSVAKEMANRFFGIVERTDGLDIDPHLDSFLAYLIAEEYTILLTNERYDEIGDDVIGRIIDLFKSKAFSGGHTQVAMNAKLDATKLAPFEELALGIKSRWLNDVIV